MRPQKLFLLIAYLLFGQNITAQNNYNNHWFFGWGQSINFDNNILQNSNKPITKQGGYLAVSNPTNGNLLFYLDIISNTNRDNIYRQVFKDSNNNVMPNGKVLYYNFDLRHYYPLVIPNPTDTLQYFVITTFEMGLQYSVVDMRLNNGLGDVVPNKKLLTLMPYNTVLTYKTTVMQGCDAVWLITRSALDNSLLSFRIDQNGIDTIPIKSYVGNFTEAEYRTIKPAIYRLKGSPHSKLLAESSVKGLELYDFEPCSGTIKNSRIIDTTASFGVCFSPDNQLLYTTRAEYQTGFFESSEIVQWDVSNAHDLNSIKASKQVILVNSAYDWPDWAGITSSYMGDIAQGKDGKLYVLSNTVYADSVQQMPTPMPPTSIVPWAQTMHIIHQPNNLGMACMPERDAHYLDGNYINRTGYYLPHPIYPVPNATIDTVLGGIQNVTQCFGQPVLLNLPTEATCIIWNTGSDSVALSVQDTGWYWAKYNLDCSIHLDSFYVTNVPLPKIPEYIIACPYQAILDIEVAPHNIHQYQYDLVHTNRNDPRKVQTDSNWTWYSLLPGAYTLRVQSGSCDTSLGIFVDTFPRPTVVVTPTNDTIAYGTTIDLTASGAYLYNWFPTISLDTGTGASVRATPLQTTTYEIIGINEYGCRDTAYTQITIDHRMEFFIPNAFSPNGDGLNDKFRLEGLSYQRLTEWGIFNRFGEQVFFTTNIQDGWDGTYRGQPCDAGVYYYYLQFFRTDGRLEERRGEVHLVR